MDANVVLQGQVLNVVASPPPPASSAPSASCLSAYALLTLLYVVPLRMMKSSCGWGGAQRKGGIMSSGRKHDHEGVSMAMTTTDSRRLWQKHKILRLQHKILR